MATAHEVAPLNAIRLPLGETGDDRRVFVNPKTVTNVILQEAADDGQISTTDLGELPLGTREIYTQRRMCGDFYCFIHGNHQVAAVGDTLQEAFANAVRLAA